MRSISGCWRTGVRQGSCEFGVCRVFCVPPQALTFPLRRPRGLGRLGATRRLPGRLLIFPGLGAESDVQFLWSSIEEHFESCRRDSPVTFPLTQ
jgi:hypothetical protein